MENLPQFSPEEIEFFEQLALDTIRDNQTTKKRKRQVRDYDGSVWGKMLRHPEVGEEGSFIN